MVWAGEALCCSTGVVAGGVVSTAGGQCTSYGQRYEMEVKMMHLCPNALASLLGDSG